MLCKGVDVNNGSAYLGLTMVAQSFVWIVTLRTDGQ